MADAGASASASGGDKTTSVANNSGNDVVIVSSAAMTEKAQWGDAVEGNPGAGPPLPPGAMCHADLEKQFGNLTFDDDHTAISKSSKIWGSGVDVPKNSVPNMSSGPVNNIFAWNVPGQNVGHSGDGWGGPSEHAISQPINMIGRRQYTGQIAEPSSLLSPSSKDMAALGMQMVDQVSHSLIILIF